jgi:VCBS repeat-containing protein
LTVVATNIAPVAANDNYTTSEDAPLVVPAAGVLGNDTDADADTLTAVLVNTVAHGSLVLNANGGFTYTPAANYNGADSFTYRANDGLTNSGVATVSITVTPVNDAPVANNQSITMPEDTITNLVLTGSDIDSAVLTYAVLAGPTNGTLSLLSTNTGAVTYTPTTNYHGADAFTFTVSDGSLYATGLVSLTLTPVNDAPVAIDDSYSVFKNTTLTVSASGVLANDIDVDGDSMTASLGVGPAHAAAFTLNADGSFTYQPVFNYVGFDTFTYRANDGLTNSALATVTLRVAATNTEPVAVNDSYTTSEDTALVVPAAGVLSNDTDADADTLTAVLVNTVAHGSLVLNANGGFTYTPAANYAGADSFTYRASDGLTNSGIATVSITVTPVNDAPVANNQSITMPEDSITNLVLTGSDVDSPVLTYAILAGPTNGTLSLLDTNTGAVTYTPTTNYDGPDAFTFTVSDGSLSATGLVSLIMTPVNDAPVAVNDSFSMFKNTTLTVPASGVLANDIDVDGDALTSAMAVGPAHAAAFSLNADGSFSYQPVFNYVGSDSFTYRASDGFTNSGLATVSLTIVATNIAPVAVNDSYTTSEDTPLVIQAAGVLGNDTDADADTLSAVLVNTVAHGALVLNANGGFTYTPAPNYNGPDGFTYMANDGQTNSGVATVSLTVTPVNDAPVADNQSVTMPEDTITNLVLTGSDIDSATLTFAVLASPTNGTLSSLDTNTHSVTYTPATNYNGQDTFTFTVFDGSLYATGVVSLTITPVNDAPVANNQSITLPEDTVTNLVLTASDVDGDALTYAVLAGPANGTLSLFDTNTGAITYRPNTNYHGPDAFTFTVSDGSLSATGLVSLTVIPVNDAPVAVNDSFSLLKNTILNVPASGVLANDSDVDGDALTAVLGTGPAHAAVFAQNPDGSFSYQPVFNYVGTDSFSYRANDGLANSTLAIVTLTIVATNTPPVAANDSYTTSEDTALVVPAAGVLGNDTDADADTLTAVLVNTVAHGSLVLNANGGFTYTPTANYNGADSFTYRANDGLTNSGVATVSLTVTPVNDAPVANNQSIAMPEDTITNLVLTGSDVDSPVLTYAILAGPTNGALSLLDTNTGAVTYTPVTNYHGADAFTFTVSDGSLSATGLVSLALTPVNDAPIAIDDSYSVFKNTTLTVAASGVMDNDIDVDGDSLSASLGVGPAHATAFALNADGSFFYQPVFNYVGFDTFTYRVSDGLTNSALATVTLRVAATNIAPVAVNDSYTTSEDTPLVVPAPGVLSNDTDADADILTAIEVTGVAHGTLSLNANGGFTYTPAANYNGPDSFTYRASDGLTNSGVATVSITVTPVNDAPVANNQSITMPEDTITNLVLTGSDVDSATLTYAILAGPTNGTLSLLDTNTGAVTYTPTTNYDGADVFTFTVSDGSLSATGLVSLTMTPVNDAPVAINDSFSLFKNTTLTVAAKGVLANDIDVDGDALTSSLSVGPAHAAAFSLNADGSFSYQPVFNYVGPDSFTYRASDGLTNSGLATVSLTIVATNIPPMAVNDSYTTSEDTILAIQAAGVLGNDTDADADTLTAVLVNNVMHGSLALNANGGFVYTPAANYNGPDSFTYMANDGSTNSGVATVSITVTPVNDAPVANNQSITMPEDTITNLVLTGSDVDSATLIFAVLASPTNGTLSLLDTNTGAVTYTPTTNYHGPDAFTFTVSDGSLYATGIVNLTLTPVNDAPVAVNDSYSMFKNTTLAIAASGVLANDIDVDGDALTATLAAGPAHATAFTLNPNGSFSYQPVFNYVGTDSFTYRASDGTTNSGLATVSLNIVATNTAPVAVNDSYTVSEDTTLTVPPAGVLGNDTDADADTLTAVQVTSVAHGTLVLNANGGFTYTPSANYNGSDSFTYRANDGLTSSSPATVTITVTPVNDAPVANNQNIVTPEDTATNLVLTGSDVDSPTLSFAVLAGPTNGTLSLLNTNTGAVTYTPATNYNGLDAFTFTVSDGSLFATGLVSLTVTPVNDAPVAVNDSFSLFKNTTLAIPASGVLANDVDVEGNALTAALGVGPAHAAAFTLNADGSFSYLPTFNYVGTDSFTYRANDGFTNSGLATVTLNILATNTPPVAVNDNYTVNEDTTLTVPPAGVLSNDTDADADSLTAVQVSNVSHGTLALNASGGFTYTPAANYHGLDSFTYRANDGLTNSGLATVSITVNPVNDAPVASNQSVTIPEDTVTNLVLTGSDVDGDSLTFAVLANPTNGTLSLLDTNTGALTYTPATNYNGQDTFTFTVFDGSLYATGVVSLTITPVNDAPVAINDNYSLFKNTTLTVPASGVLANDIDVDGDALTAIQVTIAAHGSLLLNSDGSFTYTPTPGYVGADSFTYRASDGQATSSVAVVSLNIVATNTAPVAVNDSYTLNEDTTLVVPAAGVLSNDIDIDGDVLSAILAGSVAHGTLVLNLDGSFTYTPAANYHGADSFTYRANDGLTNSGLATVTLTITSINDAPIANNQSITLPEDTATNLVLTASDVDGDPLTFALLASPTNGTVSLLDTNTGALTYTPATNYNGPDTFTFTVFDGSLYATGVVSLTITPVNDAPVANSQNVTTPEETARVITLTGSDADSDPLTFAIVANPTNGTLNVLDTHTGVVTYTPNPNFNGIDTFIFKVNDGLVDSALAAVHITVTPVNDAPVAVDDSYLMLRNTILSVPASGVLANDTDIDGDTLTALLAVGPAHAASFALNPDGSFTYRPATNYIGTDGFSYFANDGTANSGLALVSLTIVASNTSPVAVNDSFSMNQGSTLIVPAAGVLTNDLDADGDVLTAILASGPAHGALSLAANGGFTYTPVASYRGLDTFTYQATDGLSNSGIATVSITIVGTNTPPVAYDQVVTVPENFSASLLLTGSDADGNALTFAIGTTPAHGVLGTLDSHTGAVTYTPNLDFHGADAFTFQVNDGTTNSAPATVKIIVTAKPANGAPIAVDDIAYTHQNTPTTINALANDSDPEGDPLTITSVTPANGVATILSGKKVYFTPATNFIGVATIGYSISDGQGGTASALITVNVTNRPPVAVDDVATTVRNTAVTILPLLNDSDLDGDILTITKATPTNGTVSIVNGTNIVFKPKTNTRADGTVRYTISDAHGGTASALITIHITNRPPIARDDLAATRKNVPVTVSALANDSDPDRDKLTIISVSPTNGTATIVSGTRVQFRPSAGFIGAGTIGYTISDGRGGTASAVITVNVTRFADVQVLKSGPAFGVVGSNLTYNITVTNWGLLTATNVFAHDKLPDGFTFVKATPGSATVSNQIVSWPAIKLPTRGTTNFSVTVVPTAKGTYTNIAYSTTTTPDPNSQNNDGSADESRVTTVVTEQLFEFVGGINIPAVFNPQTGLFEQSVTVRNISSGPVPAVRLLVGGLRAGVSLYNATGTNSGRAYVQNNAPLNAGQTLTFMLEFYVPDRQPFTDTLEAQAVPADPTGTTKVTGVPIDVFFADTRLPGNPRYVIEFATIPGRTYTVLYSTDLTTWKTVVPSITANATRTQWYDDGPPKTESKPLSGGSRFYRVILQPSKP